MIQPDMFSSYRFADGRQQREGYHYNLYRIAEPGTFNVYLGF